MPTIDLTSKTKVYQDGSSKIDVGLTATQAQAATGDGAAVAGWYRLGYMSGGNVGREGSANLVKDEAGTTVARTTDGGDFVLSNTTQQTDAQSLRIYEWLEANPAPVRYILPTPDADVVQVHYHPAVTKDPGEQISTQKGVRTLSFTLRGDKDLRVFDDVAADQSDWAAAGLTAALDTAFA